MRAVFVGKAPLYFPDSDFVAVPGREYEIEFGRMRNGMYRLAVADIVRYHATAIAITGDWVPSYGEPPFDLLAGRGVIPFDG